jgi:DNA-binding CsgD family transcriptional regulator
MDELTFERREAEVKGVLAAILAGVAALAAVDIAGDLHAGTTPRHVWLEGGLFCLALTGAGWLMSHLVVALRTRRRLERDSAALRASLQLSQADVARWRGEASKWTQGLSEAIDRQLSEWGLTVAEKEIALLLLKGLSHKEIAAVRSVAESSVRQQARALYRKAHLQGRSELAAFFLEDLLAPRHGT